MRVSVNSAMTQIYRLFVLFEFVGIVSSHSLRIIKSQNFRAIVTLVKVKWMNNCSGNELQRMENFGCKVLESFSHTVQWH